MNALHLMPDQMIIRDQYVAFSQQAAKRARQHHPYAQQLGGLWSVGDAGQGRAARPGTIRRTRVVEHLQKKTVNRKWRSDIRYQGGTTIFVSDCHGRNQPRQG
jgi:hypothetical protein